MIEYMHHVKLKADQKKNGNPPDGNSPGDTGLICGYGKNQPGLSSKVNDHLKGRNNGPINFSNYQSEAEVNSEARLMDKGSIEWYMRKCDSTNSTRISKFTKPNCKSKPTEEDKTKPRSEEDSSLEDPGLK